MKAKFAGLMRRLHSDDRGITGLETAIILIAFVIVASVFAFVVLSTGLFSAERGKETVIAGLEKAQANVELRGDVIGNATCSGTPSVCTIDTFTFNLVLASGGKPINVDPAATTNALIVNYIDSGVREADVTFTVVNTISGNDDNILEAGELIEFTVTPPGTATLTANSTISMEIVPPSGGTMLITRTLPAKLDAAMNLH